MNELGADALVEASQRGIPQVRMASIRNGYCALAALHLAAHGWSHDLLSQCHDADVEEASNPFRTAGEVWGSSNGRLHVLQFGIDSYDDLAELVRANDVLGWDFLTIARKLGCSD